MVETDLIPVTLLSFSQSVVGMRLSRGLAGFAVLH